MSNEETGSNEKLGGLLGAGHGALAAGNRERGAGGLQGLGARLHLGVGCPKLDCA